MKIGFDFGSKNISYAVINENSVIESGSCSHDGDTTGTFTNLLSDIYKKFPKDDIETFGITGSIDLHGLRVIDPILSSVEANKFLKTGCRNILSIGSESFYLIKLDENYNYIEHVINPDCASGTGSFIVQQAERLGFSVEELAQMAHAFDAAVPSISTRCAVFAKSDIIHSQAQGFSKEAIAAGICEGVARTVLQNTLKGKKLIGDALFIGGVSSNKKIISEISKSIGIPVKVIEHSPVFNAIGAACIGMENDLNIDKVLYKMKINREERDKLQINVTQYPDFSLDKTYISDGIEITAYEDIESGNYSVFIGLDIGSTSTKAIILDENKKILAGIYAPTKGDPVNAVSEIFRKFADIFPDSELLIRGIGTTGSGRKLIKEIINADCVINEISAHAKGATFLDPDVDTIIEIGGQDSKFTTLKNGAVVNATMNYVCAAGTGSFIEEQAQRLNITLDEISGMALGQKAPFTSDRCTVYMERDLNMLLSEGYDKKQVIASVLFSVRDNYLSKVVGKTSLGEKIYFQGATGRNKALVAAFEDEIKKPILVSKYCHLTGALGCALYVMEYNLEKSAFTGIDFSFKAYSEVCTLCANKCDLRVYSAGDKITAWGLKCGRDYEDKNMKKIDTSSGIEKKYFSVFDRDLIKKENITIGIPASLYMMEYYSLFSNFFQKLGMNVVIESGSTKNMSYGKTIVNSDFCAPLVLTHGIIKSLLDKNVDYIFFPAIINEQNLLAELPAEEKYVEKTTDCYFCFYSQYASTIVNTIPSLNFKDKLISPKIKFNNRKIEQVALELAESMSGILNEPVQKLCDTFIESYNEYQENKKTWQEEGKKFLESDPDKIKILLLGRPYAVFDEKINLGIPGKIEKAGYGMIHQSMLDLKPDDEEKSDIISRMHWFYGQQILLAAEAVLEHKNIYPVFLTCFRCSPDSYLLSYFKKMMDDASKPYLVIQLDEHSSDVGYETRVEAALDSFINDFKSADKKGKQKAVITKQEHKIDKDDTIFIPFISPIISEIQKYVFESAGYKARVLPLEQRMINTGYKFTSGGECMPNAAIVGSIIDMIRSENLTPEKTALYLPTMCLACNFNQFTQLIQIAGEKAGIGGFKIINPNAIRGIPDVPMKINLNLLSVNILSSLLYKLIFRIKPYEISKGDTAAALEKSMDIIKKYLNIDKPLIEAAVEIRGLFEKIEISNEKKPKIGILGDLYTKYNSILNDDIFGFIEELGGEVVMPSYTEMLIHFIYSDVLENDLTKFYLKMVIKEEQKFEKIFSGILADSEEPPLEECISLMHEYGIRHHIIGETTISVSRMLYYIKHRLVDAVVHVNPIFCCPGVVSSSIFRKIQEDYSIPIIDLFYDGTNKPNKLIVPHMYYLTGRV